MSSSLTIPGASDARIISTFRDISKEFGATATSFNIFGGDRALNDKEGADRKLLDDIGSRNGALIVSVSATFPGLSITYKRGGPDKTGIFDSIDFSSTGGQPNPLSTSQRVSLLDKVASNFGVVQASRSIGGAASEAQAQLEALHNSILQRLEQAATDQIQKNSEYLQRLESDFVHRRQDLDASHEERTLELDKWINDQKRKLDEQETELRDKEREFDNRAHTHARRAIRGDLKKELARREQDFHLTKGTRNLRWPIHILCIALLAGIGGLLIYTSIETIGLIKSWTNDGKDVALQRPEFYYIILRQIVLAIAFGGTALFYMRWLNRWFEEHSTTEFQLKLFQLDVDRASWLVESALEWQTQVGQPMPVELVRGMGRNLFETPTTTITPSVHPADELASALMGAASRVKLNTGVAEIELEGKRLRKAKSMMPADPAKD